VARKQRGATLDGKARTLLAKLETAAAERDDALVLHTYGRACNLVGKSVVDDTLSDDTLGFIRIAHQNKYRPPVPAT
jgi:hypothetical protein